jgi:nitrite reductase/ring-hydroxylating ferredoxin subunit
MEMIKRFFQRGNGGSNSTVAGASPAGGPPEPAVTYVRCALVSDLHAGEVKQLRLRGGHEVVLALIDGTIWAVEAYCPHQGWPFKWSELDRGAGRAPQLLCGRHGWRFCMDTGEVLDPPSHDRMAVYPVRVVGDDVFVGLPGIV